MSGEYDEGIDEGPEADILRALADKDATGAIAGLLDWMGENELRAEGLDLVSMKQMGLLPDVRVVDARERDWDGLVDTHDVRALAQRRRMIADVLREVERAGDMEARSYCERLDRVLPKRRLDALAKAGRSSGGSSGAGKRTLEHTEEHAEEFAELRCRLLFLTEDALAYARDVLDARVLDANVWGEPSPDDGYADLRTVREELAGERYHSALEAEANGARLGQGNRPGGGDRPSSNDGLSAPRDPKH